MNEGYSLSIKNLVTQIANPLLKLYEPAHAEQIAWWLLEHFLAQPKLSLLTKQKIFVPKTTYDQLQQAIYDHTVLHKPIQYIIGSVPFCDLTIFVEAPILIPRPETEEWVAQLIKKLKKIKQYPLRILDLCTGTGCIALSIAHACKNVSVVGIDNNEQAIRLAQKNASKNKITNAHFLNSDLFTALDGEPFDIIVSNPPYISDNDYHNLEPSVRNWEDKKALRADDDGFSIIETIITHAPHWLNYNNLFVEYDIPSLVIEIGNTQAPKTVDVMKKNGFINTTIAKDYAFRDRVVMGSITSESKKRDVNCQHSH